MPGPKQKLLKSQSFQSSSSGKDNVEIEEINLDYKTMRSLNSKQNDKNTNSVDKAIKKSQYCSTDIPDFSSLQNSQQGHEIFTSSTRIKVGKIRLENGTIYEGEWLKGVRSGKGTLTWPNGAKYEVISHFNLGFMGEQYG